MNEIIIVFVAFAGALLTFFSGFGLGTILTPVFALFYPIEYAIIMTALVHFANNILKIILIGTSVNKSIFFSFGFASIIGAVIGSLLLGYFYSENDSVYYSLFKMEFNTSQAKLLLGTLMIVFSFVEVFAEELATSFTLKNIGLGGFVSGLFGGLSGNQGAIRSFFLSKLNLSAAEYIATGTAIARLVDISRIGVYFNTHVSFDFKFSINVLLAMLSAFAGTILGKKYLKKVNKKAINFLIALFLIAIGFGLILGIV
ncbi:MAG: TSUP family transporter [Bacteroidota bacterium]